MKPLSAGIDNVYQSPIRVGSQKMHRYRALHMINSNSRRNNDFVLLNIEKARIDSPEKCLISRKTHSINRSKNIVDLRSGHKKLTHVGL
jgi:hypothetical protein